MPSIDYAVNIQLKTNAKKVLDEVKAAAQAAAAGQITHRQYGQALSAAQTTLGRLGTPEAALTQTRLAQQAIQYARTQGLAGLRGIRKGGYDLTSARETEVEAGAGAVEARYARQQEANIQEKLAGDAEYLAATAQLTLGRRQEAAETQELLAGDADYLVNTARAALARQQEATEVQELLAGDADYLINKARAAVGRQQEAAQVQELLAGDNSYLAATAQLAAGRRQEAAGVQELLAGNADYLIDTARAAAAHQREAAEVQELLAGDDDYVINTARAALAHQQEAAAVQELLAWDDSYTGFQKRIASAKAEQAAKLQEQLAGDDLYAGYQKRIASAKAEQSAKVQEQLASDDLYVGYQKRIASAKAQQAAKVEEQLAGDDLYAGHQKRIASAKAQQAAKVEEQLAGDDLYIGYQRRVASAKAQQTAKVEEQLAGDDLYAGYQKRIASAKAQQAAKVQEQLAGDDLYAALQKRIASAKAEQAAKVEEQLAGDDVYVAFQRRIATSKAQQAAKLEEQLAGDDLYVGFQKRIASAKAEQAAKVQEQLAGDDLYAGYQRRLATAKAEQAAKVQEQLAGDDLYAGYQKRLGTAKAEQAAKVQEQLAGDDLYAGYQKRLGTAKAEQAAKVQEQLAGDDLYAAYQKRTALARAEQAAKVQEQLAGDDLYAEATKRAAVARQQQAAAVQKGLAGDPEYREATKQVARYREIQKQNAAEDLVGDTRYKEATVRAAIAREQLKAETQASLAGDPEYRRATTQAAIAREEQAAYLKAALAGDKNYVQATARAALAREELAAKVTLERAGVDYTQMNRTQLLANAAVAKRAEADLQAAATARASLGANQRGIQATVQKSVAEAELAAVVRKREATELKRLISEGKLGGTPFQRFQALVSPRPRAPVEYPRLGQLAAQKTVTTAGYAFGGAVVGAALFGTIEAVKEASQLQELFASLKGQMEALGQDDSFGTMRDRIKGISTETGVAASEVLKFAQRLLGVYNNTDEAARQTEAAMKLAVVSGTDLNTMLEELVPIATQFNKSIEEIGDLAVSLHDKFGIAEEATLHFLGEVSPLADEAGLSIEEMGVIGATAANSMGKSIQVAGEQFSKILPTMQQNQSKIVQILRGSTETEAYAPRVVEAFGRGEAGEALKVLLEAYPKLTKVQQDNLVRVSAGRREWATLNGLYANSAKLLDDMAEAEDAAGQRSGLLDSRFEKVSATLSRTMERIQTGFQNAIESILSSGIGDALNVIGTGLETAISLVGGLVQAFNKLNAVTAKLPGLGDTGLLTPIVQTTAAVLLANKAYNILSASRKGGLAATLRASAGERELAVSVGRRGTATATADETLAADTALKQTNVGVTAGLVEAEGALAVARTAGPVANVATNAGVAGTQYTGAAGTTFTQTSSGLFVPAGAAAASATGNQAANVAATAGAAGATALFAKSALLTKLFQGGRLLQFKSADFVAMQQAFPQGVAQTAQGFQNVATRNAITQAQAAAYYQTLPPPPGGGGTNPAGKAPKGSGGAGALGLAVSVAIGALQVKSAYDETKSRVDEDSKKLADTFTAASEADLERYADDYHGIMDRFQEAFFGTDLPGTLAQKELNRRRGAAGAAAAGVLTSRKWVDRFAENITDDRLVEINDALNQSDELRTYAADELGANMEGNIAEKAVGLFRKFSPQGIGRYLPGAFGKGDVKVTRENLKELLPKIQERADAGEEGAAQLAYYVEQEVRQNRSMGEIRQAMDDALASGDVNKAIEEAGGIEGFLQARGLYDPEGALQTGKITRGEYVSLIRQNVKDLEDQLKGAPDQEKAQALLNQTLAKAQQVQDQLNEERVALYTKIADITSFTPKADALRFKLEALPQYSLPKQIEQVPDLISSQWDAFQEELSHIQNPYELYQRASEGVQIDPQTQSLQILTNIRNSEKGSQLALSAAMGLEGEGYDTWLQQVAEERRDTGKSVVDIFQERVTGMKRNPYRTEEDTQRTKRFEQVLASMTDEEKRQLDEYVDVLKSPDEVLAEAAAEQTATLATAQANLREAQSGTSPMAAARAGVERANIELEKQLAIKAAGGGGPTIDAEIMNAEANRVRALQQVAQVNMDIAAALDQWAVVYAGQDPVARTNAELRAAANEANRILQANMGDARDPRYIQALQKQEQLRQQQVQNQQGITRAQMELDAFARNQDPEAAAADALRLAQFELQVAEGEEARIRALLSIRQAERQAVEASQERARAQRALVAYDRNRDPIAAGWDAVNEANIAIAEARGKGAAAEAQAAMQLKEAQRQLEDAVESAFQTDAQTAITLFNIRQDPVGAALRAVQEAERRLAVVKAQGLGESAVRAAFADLEQKRADAIDAAVAEQEDIINFMLEMGQITQSQAIERLKVERDKYAVGTKKWRDLQLKIHQLEQSAKADTQFNLPSNITLPTLYEARRLNQSRAMGIGYMDNRSVDLTFNVNGAQDPELVSTMIVNAMQSALGVGQIYTPGVTVGLN